MMSLKREEYEYFLKALKAVQSVYRDCFFFNVFLFPSVTLLINPGEKTRSFYWDNVILPNFRLHEKVNHRGTMQAFHSSYDLKYAFLYFICAWNSLQRQIIMTALRKMWSWSITKYYFITKYLKIERPHYAYEARLMKYWITLLCEIRILSMHPPGGDRWSITSVTICPFLLTDETLISFSHMKRRAVS